MGTGYPPPQPTRGLRSVVSSPSGVRAGRGMAGRKGRRRREGEEFGREGEERGKEGRRWEGICLTIVKLLPIRACERLRGKGILPIRMHTYMYLLERSIRYEQPLSELINRI